MKKLIVALCMLLAQAVYSQKENLRFHLSTGVGYDHFTSSTMKMVQEINHVPMEVMATMSGQTRFEVLAHTDSVYLMNVSYRELGLELKIEGGVAFTASSASSAVDPMSLIMKELIGRRFLIRMTDIGEVIEVKNLDQIVDTILADIPSISDIQKAEIKSQVLKSYGEKAFKGNFEMVTNIFTTAPVTIGDHWTINTALQSGMAAALSIDYTYAEKTDSSRVIRGKGVISTVDKDAYVPIPGMLAKYNVDGNTTSTIKIDKKTGWIIEANMKQTIKGDVELKGGDGASTTKTPLDITTEIHTRSK